MLELLIMLALAPIVLPLVLWVGLGLATIVISTPIVLIQSLVETFKEIFNIK